SLKKTERLFAIACGPSPIRINGPEWDMSEDDNRLARRPATHVRFEPFELIVSKLSHPLEHRRVVQTDEVDALMIEAVPAAPLRAERFAVPIEIQFAVVNRGVVFARNVVDLLRPGRLKNLIHRVELGRFRLMAQIACVDDEIRLVRKLVDLVDGSLQRRGDV